MPKHLFPAAAGGLPNRRGFLSGLARLPLIGGSVTLIGAPVAAAEPVTPDLLWSYKNWLHYEHRMLSFELANHDPAKCREVERFFSSGNAGDRFHFQYDVPERSQMAGWEYAPQPSTRAAVVLASVGCDWKGGDHV